MEVLATGTEIRKAVERDVYWYKGDVFDGIF